MNPRAAGSPGCLGISLENHCRSLCLYFYWYNSCRPHSAVRTKRNNQITPAMAVGLTDRPATMEQLVEMIDARAEAEALQAPRFELTHYPQSLLGEPQQSIV